MSIKDLVLHLEPGATAEDPAASTALALASAFGAHLTALVFETDVVSPLAFRSGPTGTPAPSTEAGVAATRAALDAAVEKAGVLGTCVVDHSYAYGIGEVLADYLKVHDLGVLGLADIEKPGRRMLVEAALFESGRPVVFVPPKAPLAGAPKRIVVAWDATPTAARAVEASLPFLKAADEVLVVAVADDKAFRPGSSGPALTNHLARHGVSATFETVERGSGDVFAAIAGRAAGFRADLVVMGAYGHSRLRDFVFGSATRGALSAGTSLPILMMH